MDSFKKLDEPPGVLGISFEDWKLLLLVACSAIMLSNFAGRMMQLPSWTFWVLLGMSLGAYYLLKRSNKTKTPYFIQSRVAWLITKKSFIVTHTKLHHYDQPDETTEEKREKPH